MNDEEEEIGEDGKPKEKHRNPKGNHGKLMQTLVDTSILGVSQGRKTKENLRSPRDPGPGHCVLVCVFRL